MFTLDDLHELAVQLGIEITPETLTLLHQDLSEVLVHAATLQDLDLPVTPSPRVTPPTRLRDDDAIPPTPTLSPDTLAMLSPRLTADGLVMVPKVMDKTMGEESS